MSSIVVPIGAFAGVYVGDYSISTPMSQLVPLRTGGLNIRETFPTSYYRCIDNAIQTGNHKVEFKMNFYSVDDTIFRLTRGLTISEAVNDPNANSLYSIFLLSNDTAQSNSFYFPKVRAEKVSDFTYGKTNATIISLNFTGENRDPNVILMYKGTGATLKALMGSISPI